MIDTVPTFQTPEPSHTSRPVYSWGEGGGGAHASLFPSLVATVPGIVVITNEPVHWRYSPPPLELGLFQIPLCCNCDRHSVSKKW